MIRVCIDPGHGGKDPGCVGVGAVREAEVNLLAARELQPVLARAGFEVLLTRSGDSHVSLPERCRIANEARADVFVSIHCNAPGSDADRSKVRGIETYRLPGGQAERIAQRIHELALIFTDAPDRGCKNHWLKLTVLHATKMPAVLFELGYLTHPSEGVLLCEAAYRQAWTHAITAGLLGWAREVKQ
jgi:N-acetylmuramoyl-L-alanine amidase